MLVKDLMSTNVVTVTPETLVSEVAEILHQHHFSGLPVVNEQGVVIGTVSERDFITAESNLYLPTYIKMLSNMDYIQGGKKELPHVVNQIINATVKDIMNQQVPFVRPDTPLEQLATIFGEQRVNPVPVTDSTNKLIGIISRSDLIKFFSPKQVKMGYVTETRTRKIDQQVDFTQGHFRDNFAYVAKARANIWITTAVVLFIVGFLAGIFYVANPDVFTKETPGNQIQQ